MYAALVLALLTSSAGADGTGTVRGTVKLTEDGFPLSCVAVYLIPASPMSDELVARKFGGNEEAIKATLLPQIANRERVAPPQGTQEASCRRGRFTNTFEFSDVAAGDYYLTTMATPSWSHSEDQLRRSSVEMMRRISVAPDSSVAVHFR